MASVATKIAFIGNMHMDTREIKFVDFKSEANFTSEALRHLKLLNDHRVLKMAVRGNMQITYIRQA